MYRTTRRNVLKTGVAMGLASLGWVGTLVPELRTARASQIPKARLDKLSGIQLTDAVERVLSKPHIRPLSAELSQRGFVRTGEDMALAIQSDARGQDQLTYVWYANTRGERARLTDLASNSKVAAITTVSGRAPSPVIADSFQASESGEIIHVEHGVLKASHATVTSVTTGVTKSYDLGPVHSESATPSGPVMDVEAGYCYGPGCGDECKWLTGHACSISCGIAGTLFCTLCCWWCVPCGVACGIAWVFICEYGWSCNGITCCLVGACCCT
jgi:hypothetical protein